MPGVNSDLFDAKPNTENSFAIRLDGKIVYTGNRKTMMKKLINLQELQPEKNWKFEYRGEHKMIQRSGKKAMYGIN